MTKALDNSQPINYINSFELTITHSGVSVTPYSSLTNEYPARRIFLVHTYTVRSNTHIVHQFNILGLDRIAGDIYFDLNENRRIFKIMHVYLNGENTLYIFFSDAGTSSMDFRRFDIELTNYPTALDLESALNKVSQLNILEVSNLATW